MASSNIPSTMRAWQYGIMQGGIENSLKLNTSATVPTPKADQHLVRIIATSLNPVDYKPSEVPIMRRLAVANPATPCVDFVGRVAKPADGSSLKPDQLIFGFAGLSPFAGGALAEYALVQSKAAIAMPEGVNPVDAGSIGVCGMTAWQSIVPYTKTGSRLFINGGSGGTGIFGIQIGKLHGCHVVTTCSTANVELCKSLGADEVIDYRKESVLEALKRQKPFDHVVDNVGSDQNLYWRAHDYTTPSATYMYIAGTPSFQFLSFTLKARYWPGFLGGAKRKYGSLFAEPKLDQLKQIADWMAEGKIKAVIDEKFSFDRAPESFRRSKTGRAKGKIVVEVAPELVKS